MIAALCAPYSISNQTIVIGASIGIAVDPRAHRRRRRHHAPRRHGALSRQERGPQPRLHLRYGDGRRSAQAQAARERPARGDRAATSSSVAYQPIVNNSGEKVRRRRGALPLDASDARRGSAVRIHPDRRAQRADHRARRMGAAPRLPRRQGVAGHHGRGQCLAAAVPPLRFRRRGRAHPGRDRFRPDAARARGHREHAARQCRHRRTRDDPAQGARRAACARRFRHRLFEPALSAPLPVRQAQDRPQLRALDRAARRTPPRSCMPSSASAAASA